MKRFYRLCTGGPFGDETSSYEIILPEDEDITVEDFIEQILVDEPDEWGDIYNGMHKIIADYKRGEATFRDGYDSIKHKKIISVKAHGGWSMMDYYLELKPNPKVLVDEYDYEQISMFDF